MGTSESQPTASPRRIVLSASLMLCAVGLFPAGNVGAAEDLDGLPIVSIRFQRYNVFDTSERRTSFVTYRWANGIHIVSKEDFLGLLSVGVMFFGDAGMTWAPRVGPPTNGVRVDAGVGLLFDLSHLSRTSLIQISAGVPDDTSGVTFIVSTSSIF